MLNKTRLVYVKYSKSKGIKGGGHPYSDGWSRARRAQAASPRRGVTAAERGGRRASRRQVHCRGNGAAPEAGGGQDGADPERGDVRGGKDGADLEAGGAGVGAASGRGCPGPGRAWRRRRPASALQGGGRGGGPRVARRGGGSAAERSGKPAARAAVDGGGGRGLREKT